MPAPPADQNKQKISESGKRPQYAGAKSLKLLKTTPRANHPISHARKRDLYDLEFTSHICGIWASCPHLRNGVPVPIWEGYE
jgi:hypothetical protein